MPLSIKLNVKDADSGIYRTVYEDEISHTWSDFAVMLGVYNAIWRPYRLLPNYNVKKWDYLGEIYFEKENVCRAELILKIVKEGYDSTNGRLSLFNNLLPKGEKNCEVFLNFIGKYSRFLNRFPDAIINVSRM